MGIKGSAFVTQSPVSAAEAITCDLAAGSHLSPLSFCEPSQSMW